MALDVLSQQFRRLIGKPPSSLAGISQPTEVEVVGRVVSPNDIASPVTPVRAAAMTCALMYRHGRQMGDLEAFAMMGVAGMLINEAASQQVSLINAVTRLTELLVDVAGRRLAISPSRMLRIDYLTAIGRNAQSLVGAPPAELWPAGMQHHPRLEICYGERFLTTGDEVFVRATVEPSGHGVGGYRHAGSGDDAPDFVARSDQPILVRERPIRL